MQNESLTITGMQVEYLENPLGIDINKPRFSWKLSSVERGVYQDSYQIIVGEKPEDIKKGKGLIWDSGKKRSGQTVNIEFDGMALSSNRIYYWRITTWLKSGDIYHSEISSFHTGILKPSDWKAEWITSKEEVYGESQLMRKEFKLEKKVKQAYAYVSACGFYEFYLNGRKVGDHVLSPSITDYRKRVLYSVYDVSEYLNKGKNTAGAMLGNGAWNLFKLKNRYTWHDSVLKLGNPELFLQIMISYTDGSEEMIITDNSWKYTSGPIIFNNLYGGEDYDARKELPGWNTIGFNDDNWKLTVVSTTKKGKLKSEMMPPLRITHTLKPIKKINPSPGIFIFDLGQNIAGWWKIEVKGNPGQAIRVRGDETLNNLLFPKNLEEGDSLSTNTRYHPRIWTEYIISGNQKEVYEPRFFYNGFRYIEVKTSDGKNPAVLNVEGRVVRTDLKRNGLFVSSDSLLNRIHRTGIWSQMGNTHSYPTDCPQREKGAYNGDGQVIAETTIHDFHAPAYYTKWLNDIRDAQQENGRIPNTSPTLIGGMGGGVAWGSVYILLPWWMNHYYNDLRILQEHYPDMKRYLLYLKELGTKDENPDEPYIIDNFYEYWYSLGEWCAPGQSDCPVHAVVNTFYYYYSATIMSEIARVLEKYEDELYFKELSEKIKEAFNRNFFNPENSLYGTDETYQTYQLLALLGDIVPEGYKQKVFRTIVDDINERDKHLNTGIWGTKYFWPILVKNGESELAYSLATQTSYPSYGFWINNGSTTFPEDWPAKKSHNHQMFGSVVEYFYKYLGGIQSPMEGNTTKGYQHIHIEPMVPEKLSSVDASVESVAGLIKSSWFKEEGTFNIQVSIPPNTIGTISLHINEKNQFEITEGSRLIFSDNIFIRGVKGIKNIEHAHDRLNIHTESGNFSFKIIEKSEKSQIQH